MKFEYAIKKYDAKGFLGGKIDLSEVQREFNQMGQSGWELVTFMDTNEAYGGTKWVIATFKRHISG